MARFMMNESKQKKVIRDWSHVMSYVGIKLCHGSYVFIFSSYGFVLLRPCFFPFSFFLSFFFF